MILDITTGFNTRVNLYIIYHIYYNMKKAPIFMKPGKGRRDASDDIGLYIEMSRQRLFNIFKGRNYLMDDKTADKIAGLFNISADYFGKDSELIKIHGITENDWKCFFHQRNPSSVNNVTKIREELENGEKRVNEGLKKITDHGYVTNNYDTASPIYRISYHFTNGTAYKGASRMDKFLQALEILEITDWKVLINDKEKLIKYMELMKKHYEYVSAYIKCQELEGKL